MSAPVGAGGEWVLVPREPTQAMLDAGHWPCVQGRGAKSVWATMLAAAPQPPAEAQRCTCPSGDGSLRWPCPAHPAEAQPVDQTFAEWLVSEMPAGTVIGDPAWWAGRIARQYAKRTSPPSAPVGVEGWPLRYFAYDSDNGNYDEFDTLPEAIACAQESLDYAGDDGWPDGGPTIVYGAVLGEAREVEGSRRPRGPLDNPDFDFIVNYELTGAALAQQPAAVDGDWRKKAAEWLESKAVEQEDANQKWPEHAARYKEWRDRPSFLRYLAFHILLVQQGGDT